MSPENEFPTEPAVSPVSRPPAAAPRSAMEGTLETVARELMRDRRSERRWRVFFRLAWLGVVLALLWAMFVGRDAVTAPSGAHTALVEVRGEIAPDAEASAERIVSALKNAFEDKGAQAIVLRINSPGGSPVQAGIVNDEIKRLKLKHSKKVYAVVEEICASGAYYIAVAADEIYVDKASLVGSIGVLMDGFGFTGTMEKLGVERRLLTAGENKGMLDPFSPLDAKSRQHAQKMLNEVHQQFIDAVKQGRGDALKPNKEIFSGLFWSGTRAKELGLVDEFGSAGHVAREVIGAEDIVDYTVQENLLHRLTQQLGMAMGRGVASELKLPQSQLR